MGFKKLPILNWLEHGTARYWCRHFILRRCNDLCPIWEFQQTRLRFAGGAAKSDRGGPFHSFSLPGDAGPATHILEVLSTPTSVHFHRRHTSSPNSSIDQRARHINVHTARVLIVLDLLLAQPLLQRPIVTTYFSFTSLPDLLRLVLAIPIVPVKVPPTSTTITFAVAIKVTILSRPSF